MNTAVWFVMLGISVSVFIWATRRQRQQRQQEVAWQAKYGQIISAIRRTDTVSSTLATISTVTAVVSLIAAVLSLLSAS